MSPPLNIPPTHALDDVAMLLDDVLQQVKVPFVRIPDAGGAHRALVGQHLHSTAKQEPESCHESGRQHVRQGNKRSLQCSSARATAGSGPLWYAVLLANACTDLEGEGGVRAGEPRAGELHLAYIHAQKNTHRNRTNRQTDRQTDKQTNRRTDRQTNRRTDTDTHTHTQFKQRDPHPCK
jgi:hypothetical protein